MKGNKVFRIDGKLIEQPLFEKGDIVGLNDNSTTAIDPIGTVEGTRSDGLFVDIIWDKQSYLSKSGGNIQLGKGWIVSSVRLIRSQLDSM